MSDDKKPLKPSGDKLPKRPGQWLALNGEDTAGVGHTADAARVEARVSRARERPQLAYMPIPNQIKAALPSELDDVLAAIPEDMHDRIWLVGGAVRDAILRRPIHDLDFVVDGDSIGIARLVADKLGGNFFILDAERKFGRVILAESAPRFEIDFAPLEGKNIVADLLARDFAVNAMALAFPLDQGVIDPAGGQADLRHRALRRVTPQAMQADPLRTLRAVRHAADLGFHIERETRADIRDAVGLLETISVERLRDELMRCMEGPKPAATLRAMALLGVLAEGFPTLQLGQAFEQALAVQDKLSGVLSVLSARHDIDAASEFALGLVASRVGRYRQKISERLKEEITPGRSRRGLLFLGALIRELVAVDAFAHLLRLSSGEIRWLVKVTESVNAASQLAGSGSLPSALEIHRFFRKTGEGGVEACLLALADILARYGPELEQDYWAAFLTGTVEILSGYFHRYESVIDPPLLVDGNDLMAALNIPAGPRIGELLSSVREAQVVGEVATREKALDFARDLPTDDY